jgi:hypothetical protein
MSDFESVKAPSVATPTGNYRKVVRQGEEWMERCYIVTGGGAEPRLEWRKVQTLNVEVIDD